MFRNLKTVMVDLNRAKGSAFSGPAEGLELRTTDGVIAINPQEESYLNLTQTTRITLRVGTEFLDFVLKNAADYLAALAELEAIVGTDLTEAASPKTITPASKRRRP